MPVRYHLLFVLILFLVSTQTAWTASFNTHEVFNLSGKKGELAADEGYLYLSLETTTNMSRITFDGIGFGNKFRMNDIEEGQNYALLKVKAGDYYWEHLNIYVGIGNVRRSFKPDDYAFTVKPGVINYPGSWKFKTKWEKNQRVSYELDNFNHLSFEMMHFKKLFPKYSELVPFSYQGKVDDPYASHLSDVINESKQKPLPNLYYTAENIAQSPMQVYSKTSPTNLYEKKYPELKSYFKLEEQNIRSFISGGDFLLFNAILNDVVTVGLIDVTNYQTYVLYQQLLPPGTRVSSLDWIDKNSFFLTLTNQGNDISYVAHLDIQKQQNKVNAKFIKFREQGRLLSGLTAQEDKILFVKKHEPGSRTNNNLYLLDVTSEQSLDDSFKKIHKPTRKLKNVVDWLVDSSGQVRAAITVAYDRKKEVPIVSYWFLPNPTNDDWEQVKTMVDPEHFIWLKGLSKDESYFLVVTNEFSDKNAIHKYATKDGTHLGVFYENKDHDIRDVFFDSLTQEVVAYSYVENGLPQVHYFKPLDQHLKSAMAGNPDLSLFEAQTMPAHDRLLLYGFTPNSKGAWYLLNTVSGRADKIFDTSPGYENLPKGEHHVLQVKAADGISLEGFLVMPKSADQSKKHPLVVMPHGGPIGVQDFAHNNAIQHFLAAQGLASLKVNFRGSGGYGKSFEESGKREWGEKIEQDIQTMTAHALQTYALDKNKICAMGGSYGGYSAVMLTHLYPEQFKCAVSFAGVMDLPLLFTSKDLSRDQYLLDVMSDIVGNPTVEIEKLIQKSPLYLLENMQRPLLLFQGLEDSTVRPEHAFRMQQLISLYGMDHEVVLFQDEGHSYSHVNTIIIYLARSVDFIKENLNIQ